MFGDVNAYLSDRNRIPWIVISCCIVSSTIVIIILRTMLVHENKKRDAEPHDDTYDDVVVVKEGEDGKKVEQRVDKVSPFLRHDEKPELINSLRRLSWILQMFRTEISATFCDPWFFDMPCTTLVRTMRRPRFGRSLSCRR